MPGTILIVILVLALMGACYAGRIAAGVGDIIRARSWTGPSDYCHTSDSRPDLNQKRGQDATFQETAVR
jgi:hypothetical protein